MTADMAAETTADTRAGRSSLSTTNPDLPSGPLTHRQIVTILIGLMMGMFLAALDQTIVASAMRTIADDLQGLSAQAWVTTAYLITSTIVTPLYGKLSDIYGRKPFFIFAISIFTVGSVLCTLATSIGTLAMYRAVQGLGAGGLMALALAIIGDIVPPRERAKYQGYFLAVFGTSSVLGPVIGGFFAGQENIFGITGWRWVFLVNVPIAIAALIVLTRTLHLHHERRDHRIDYWGAVTLTIGLVPLLIIAEQGREWGWGSSSALICYGIGVLGLVAFFVIERAMGEEALVPLRLFQIRTVGVSSIVSVFIGMGMFGGIAALPLYLQIVKGATPTQAGLQLLPLTLGIMFGSILSGQLISRTGRYRQYPIMGAFLLAASCFALHYTQADTPLWKTLIAVVFFGVGLGFNFQPLTLAVQNAVSPRDIGVATSSATFTRQIGGTLGTAVFLSILFSKAAENIPAAYSAARQDPNFIAALQNPQADAAANASFTPGMKDPAPGTAVPGRLLPGDVDGVPRGDVHPAHRVCRLVLPAPRGAASQLGLQRARRQRRTRRGDTSVGRSGGRPGGRPCGHSGGRCARGCGRRRLGAVAQRPEARAAPGGTGREAALTHTGSS